MKIPILNAAVQTQIFIIILSLALIASFRFLKNHEFFPGRLTTEIKGFAMMAILLGHIGFQLSADYMFLYPISVLSGAGVNLFLFLSGYGLSISSAKSNLSVFGFYKKKLIKLFLPLWIVLCLVLAADYFILHKTYPSLEVVRAFFGFFPRADVTINIDSPLWYFTFILFCYLIYPLVFRKDQLYLSALAIFAILLGVLNLNTPLHPDLVTLYKVHSGSFPLGVLFAALTLHENLPVRKFLVRIRELKLIFKTPLMLVILFLICYTAIYSHYGEGVILEQSVSVFTTLCILLFFFLKDFESRLFVIFGIYSYEIYLTHWPILFRYDFIYKNLPGAMATTLYLLLFLGIGYVLQKFSDRVFLKIKDL